MRRHQLVERQPDKEAERPVVKGLLLPRDVARPYLKKEKVRVEVVQEAVDAAPFQAPPKMHNAIG